MSRQGLAPGQCETRIGGFEILINRLLSFECAFDICPQISNSSEHMEFNPQLQLQGLWVRFYLNPNRVTGLVRERHPWSTLPDFCRP